MDFPRPGCPNAHNCEDMKRGVCKFWHKTCLNGNDCWNWKKMQCAFYHPQTYSAYLRTQKVQQIHHHQNAHSERNRRRASNDNNDINSKLVKPAQKKEQTATRGRTLWFCYIFFHSFYIRPIKTPRAAWEDEILLKYVRRYNQKVNEQIGAEIRRELRDGRTVGAILTRLRVTIIPRVNAQNAKHKNEENTSNANKYVRDEDKNGNPSNKERVYLLFNKLIRYYHAQNNKFDAKNLERKLCEFKKKGWNGQIDEMNRILLNTPLRHFEDKLMKMEKEYGVIDLKMEQQVISKLNSVKKALKHCINETTSTIMSLKGKCFVNESDFLDITGYDVGYFQNVLDAINAPKIKEAKPNIAIKSETNDCNMPKLEEEDESNTDSKDDNISIKQEEPWDNRNVNNSDQRSDRDHRERRRARRRSRTRSRSRERHRHHHRHRDRHRSKHSRSRHHEGHGYDRRRSYTRSRSRC